MGAFTEAIVTQYRNPHVYMKDYKDELDLYSKTQSLLQVISDWLQHQALSVKSLSEAYISLLKHLADHRDAFIGHKDVDLAKAWVSDLQAVGYEWPPLLEPSARQVLVKIRQPREIDGRSEKVTR